MARITLSSLVSFLVVLLIATTSNAAAVYRLYNGDSWAKNFPPGGGRPPFFTGVAVDDSFASVYERWAIERFEEGYRIQNTGTGFWLTARGGEVEGASDFNPESSKWYVQSAGEGKFKISAPNKDLVITTRRRQPDYPVTLFLEPARGEPEQLWSFEHIM
ncbi:hypothetical protein BGZ93_007057 [Podila epicladia]|nr:hypothetical protein BGZ92_003910 [Podila epicladia]KAG0094565.1 hypothetical protein BGZ93_007057 [Podila epicladia]